MNDIGTNPEDKCSFCAEYGKTRMIFIPRKNNIIILSPSIPSLPFLVGFI